MRKRRKGLPPALALPTPPSIGCLILRPYGKVMSKEVSVYKLIKKCIKVHTATRWTIRHSLMLLWFADLMNVTEEVTIHRPDVSTLLSSAFIKGDLNAETRGPLI